MSVALIVPTYGKFDYALKTVQSFFEHSPEDSLVYLIDDGHPGWTDVDWSKWPKHVMLPADSSEVYTAGRTDERLLCFHFGKNDGLTRSWNMGLRISNNPAWAADVVICGNSDIILSPGWYPPVLAALGRYALVGPVTNASGRIAAQNVSRLLPGYRPDDSPEAIANVAETLRAKHPGVVKRSSLISGFFMAAKRDVWWSGAVSKNSVFHPRNKMNYAAHELETRWQRKGRRVGIVADSFVFHYRAVTRGAGALKGGYGKGSWRPVHKAE
jgi:glycosyltransferase involved in cell wall biosynthesis